MANVEIVRLPPDASLDLIVRAINTLNDMFLGNDGGRVLMVGHDGTSTDPNLGTSTGSGLYQTVIRSDGTNHLQVRNSGDTTDMLAVTDTAATAQALAVAAQSTFTGAITANSTATFNGSATFQSTVVGNGTVQFKTPISAAASASLTLTTTPTNITGASLSLTPGIWRVTGVFAFWALGAGDVGSFLIGQLAATGGTATIPLSTSHAVLKAPTANTYATVTQTWLVTVTATTTAALQAYKDVGTGTSTCELNHTTITATNA